MSVPLDGLLLWLDAAGEPSVGELDGRPYALASSVASAEAAGAPAAAVPQRYPDGTDLLAEVPAGFGLRIDAATAGARLLLADQIDGFRGGEPPRGDEVGVRIEAAPRHLASVTQAARQQARAVGARGLHAVLLRLPSGASGLVIDVVGSAAGRAASEAELDAALDAVRRHAPQERVRVVSVTDLPGGHRGPLAALLLGRWRPPRRAG